MAEPEDIEMEVDLVFTMVAANSCASTIAGWIWYCDEHNTHGNADSHEEAHHMAEAHVEYHADGDSDYDECSIYIANKN